jgi:hypothetical protein
MNTVHVRTLVALAVAAIAQGVASQTPPAVAGTLLFTQPGVQIIGSNGQSRPARQGDVIRTGERLITPINAISQVKLPDGSLVGVRPGSELRMDTPPGIARSEQVLSLISGNVRVVGADIFGGKTNPGGLTLKSGGASIDAGKADLESAVVRREGSVGNAGATKSSDPGSYNRLIAGTGNQRSGTDFRPLVAREVSFVSPDGLRTAALANVSPNLFASGVVRDAGSLALLVPPSAPATSGLSIMSPTTSTLGSPLPGLAVTGTISGAGLLPPPPPGVAPLPTFSPITTSAFPTPTLQTSPLSGPTGTLSPVLAPLPIAPMPMPMVAPRPPLPPPPPIALRPLTCAPNNLGVMICR